MVGDRTMPEGENGGGPARLGTAVLVVSLVLTALVTGLGYLSFKQRLDASPLDLPSATRTSSASPENRATSAPAVVEAVESPEASVAAAPVVVVPATPVATENPQKLASALSVLMSARSQIELYKLQHHDEAPDLINRGWEPLLRRTTAGGTTSEDGEFGPYFRSTPVNPLNGQSRVILVAVAHGTTPELPDGGEPAGFLFNPPSGMIWATDASGLRPMDESKASVAAREVAIRRPATPATPDSKMTLQAKRTTLQLRLGVLRSQIELYKLQHHDRPPDLSAYPGWAQLMNRTRADGRVDSRGEYGPYLRSTLVNPLNGSTLVRVVKSFPAEGTIARVGGVAGKVAGFLYESPTGRVAGTDSRGAVVIDDDLATSLRGRTPR